MMKIEVTYDGFNTLTKGKIYNVTVIEPFKDGIVIEIINDDGFKEEYLYPTSFFKDVTIEIRSDIIDGILK